MVKERCSCSSLGCFEVFFVLCHSGPPLRSGKEVDKSADSSPYLVPARMSTCVQLDPLIPVSKPLRTRDRVNVSDCSCGCGGTNVTRQGQIDLAGSTNRWPAKGRVERARYRAQGRPLYHQLCISSDLPIAIRTLKYGYAQVAGRGARARIAETEGRSLISVQPYATT